MSLPPNLQQKCPKCNGNRNQVSGTDNWYCMNCQQSSSDITGHKKGKSRHNVSTPEKRTADDIKFDSQLEMFRYLALKDMQRAGMITELQLQPYFSLDLGWVHVATYKADFTYIDVATGLRIFEDVKSLGPSGTINNRDTKLAMGMVRSLHKGITITVVTSKDKGRTWISIPAEKVFVCEEVP